MLILENKTKMTTRAFGSLRRLSPARFSVRLFPPEPPLITELQKQYYRSSITEAESARLGAGFVVFSVMSMISYRSKWAPWLGAGFVAVFGYTLCIFSCSNWKPWLCDTGFCRVFKFWKAMIL